MPLYTRLPHHSPPYTRNQASVPFTVPTYSHSLRDTWWVCPKRVIVRGHLERDTCCKWAFLHQPPSPSDCPLTSSVTSPLSLWNLHANPTAPSTPLTYHSTLTLHSTSTHHPPWFCTGPHILQHYTNTSHQPPTSHYTPISQHASLRHTQPPPNISQLISVSIVPPWWWSFLAALNMANLDSWLIWIKADIQVTVCRWLSVSWYCKDFHRQCSLVYMCVPDGRRHIIPQLGIIFYLSKLYTQMAFISSQHKSHVE